MATKSQFTQINATQWNTLGARFQARIDLFSPALAEKIPYELAAAMSASPTFLTLLDRQAVFRDADGSITVGSGTEANVCGGGNAAIISINPSEIILFVNQPATMVLRFAHELGHATRPDGVGGFTDLNGVVWPSPFAYHQVVGLQVVAGRRVRSPISHSGINQVEIGEADLFPNRYSSGSIHASDDHAFVL